MLSAKRIIGKMDEIAGTIEQSLGDEMHYLFRAALNMPFNDYQARAHHLFAKALHDLRPNHNIGNAGFVLQRHEDDPAGAARSLPYQHQPGATDMLLVVRIGNRRTGDDTFFGKR